jgi:hypothetical protein
MLLMADGSEMCGGMGDTPTDASFLSERMILG